MAKVTPEQIVKPIKWLIGNWRSTEALGQFPGIPNFFYEDIMKFTFCDQPLLNFTSETYLKKKKAHIETGFMKIKPGSNLLSFVLSHNFGITSMEEGVVCGNQIILKSTEISRTSFNTGAQVCELQRNYTLSGNNLLMVIYMSTNQKPLSKHLTVQYMKTN